MMIMKILLLFCASVVLLASARPQTQLKWNWEEVILSRNGPSTTSTPRPTRWTTTTLRFIEEAPPLIGAGSVGTAEIVSKQSAGHGAGQNGQSLEHSSATAVIPAAQ